MFNFSGMLAKYAQPITLVTEAAGQWIAGQWVPGAATHTVITAPVLPISPDDMRFDTLTYKTNDRKIYVHQKIEVGQKVKTEVAYAGAEIERSDSTITILTTLTGLAGNDVTVVFSNTGEAGFAASYHAGTKQIRLNFGGDTEATAEQVTAAINGLTLFTATTNEVAEDETEAVFTLSDIGTIATLSGGQEVEYTVMAERDYSFHANGLRIYILSRSDAGD